MPPNSEISAPESTSPALIGTPIAAVGALTGAGAHRKRILYSLRYRDDTHIAHELGEHIISSEPWFPNVELCADDN
jgi:hypothetical protein